LHHHRDHDDEYTCENHRRTGLLGAQIFRAKEEHAQSDGERNHGVVEQRLEAARGVHTAEQHEQTAQRVQQAHHQKLHFRETSHLDGDGIL
jgi:hypothetical protein